ncbi:MAG: NAD-binding protein [Actinomycetota bacterium]|nr:NAD-binding protein [Actinomycetota bacterium]MDP9476963.1 NAD-binding protein [Actinomycetota bacterium]MDP9487082.1 NAD-binding protein [Actinomycetota bacterium]
MRRALSRLRKAALALGAIVVGGTAGYMVLEGWGFLDALYMTMITISTVGYGEVNALGTPGRLWSMALIITGASVLVYATSSFVELVLEGTIRGYFARRRMEDAIGKLNGHYILCGYGRVGRKIAEEFANEDVDFVVIDEKESEVERCLEDGYLALRGNASDNAVLEAVGIKRAKGLVAAVDSDADNLFVTFSARKMNPELRIVARANSEESATKLKQAGADRSLSPYAVEGRRLAAFAIQPEIVDFLDVVAHNKRGLKLSLEEIEVPAGSPLEAGASGRIKAAEQTGAKIVAVLDEEGDLDTAPSPNDEILPGTTLIVLGTGEQVARLDRFIQSGEP